MVSSKHLSSCNSNAFPYLHTALREAKPLLDHSGQLSDPTALLSQNILGPKDSLRHSGLLACVKNSQ